MEVWIHALLKSVLDGGEWSVTSSGCFYRRKGSSKVPITLRSAPVGDEEGFYNSMMVRDSPCPSNWR